MSSTEMLTPEAAGVYLGGADDPIPVATLQWWRTTGRGPKYIKIAKRVRYLRQDLDAFLARCGHPGGSNRLEASQ